MLNVSLRAFSRRILIHARLTLQLAIVAWSALVLSTCARKAEFQERGLPADLPNYLAQLEAIKVPAAVSKLDWIPSTLKVLDASGTAISAIPFVPIGMERLDVHGAKNLKYLPTLPSSIRELDIRFTQIEGPWRFPNNLEALALGGERVQTLEGLSESALLELKLDQVPNLQSSDGLPEDLQVLSISDATFSQLVGVSPQLKKLHLDNTQIRSLKGLPESLQSIILIQNGVLQAELPWSLLSLTVDSGPQGQQRLLSMDKLKFLNYLELRTYIPFMALPLLRELRVPAPLSWKNAPSLRRLEIAAEGIQHLPELPRGLEELRWPGGGDLDGGSELRKLPHGLKRLDISSSGLKDLAKLPSAVTLESLDVSWTSIGIDKLPASLLSLRYRSYASAVVADLPKGLRRLDLKGSMAVRILQDLPPLLENLDVSQTSVAELPELPVTLRELDISNTRISTLQHLKNLPRLRKLTVHAGQFKSLVGLPGGVSELRFVERQ